MEGWEHSEPQDNPTSVVELGKHLHPAPIRKVFIAKLPQPKPDVLNAFSTIP